MLYPRALGRGKVSKLQSCLGRCRHRMYSFLWGVDCAHFQGGYSSALRAPKVKRAGIAGCPGGGQVGNDRSPTGPSPGRNLAPGPRWGSRPAALQASCSPQISKRWGSSLEPAPNPPLPHLPRPKAPKLQWRGPGNAKVVTGTNAACPSEAAWSSWGVGGTWGARGHAGTGERTLGRAGARGRDPHHRSSRSSSCPLALLDSPSRFPASWRS